MNLMFTLIISLSVIAVLLTIFWDVRRRKNLPKNSTLPQPNEKIKWLVHIACGMLFSLVGTWMYFDPPEPSFGAKGLLFHLAYLLIGKYGPSLVFFVFGFACFIVSEKHRRNTQKS
jgi:hypothetical protein